MKYINLIILCFLFVSCKEDETVVKHLKYVKDGKTGICFAVFSGGNGSNISGFTYVPCFDSIKVVN